MRTLPPERLYLPFEAGPYRMAMGLVTLPDSAWFELDNHYASEMAERRRLLRDHHAEVFAALPVSASARAETLTAVIDNLTTHHPDWFVRDGDRLFNHLTGEHWDLADLACDPLELAGRLVQEDLCLIQVADTVPMFTAAVLCFPTRWRLDEKLGRPLAQVHGAVPLYADRLAAPVDRFMRHVKPGYVASRINWSVVDNAALFQPAGKWRTGHNPTVTAANAGASLFLRVERQTLRRLPLFDAVVFGIRVHVYPLAQAIRDAATAERLADAVRALPEATQHYKSLLSIRDALLGWLDARRHGAASRAAAV
jgi:dimethylamine monooxygenase subunit A